VAGDSGHYSDIVCSFCGRHNREVRVVANDNGLILCQVCVANAAQIFDEEVGVDGPRDWRRRWPLKQAPPIARDTPPRRPLASRAIPFQIVIHSDWSTSPHKRWSAEARLIDGGWVASAHRLVPNPTALITPGKPKLLGFDFPIGLPIAYASQVGIDDFLSFLPKFGHGDWESFYLPATTPSEISLRRPFGSRALPGGARLTAKPPRLLRIPLAYREDAVSPSRHRSRHMGRRRSTPRSCHGSRPPPQPSRRPLREVRRRAARPRAVECGKRASLLGRGPH
jgi:hypothetical protein